MNRREIEEELKKHNSTLLSFPERGPWGSSSYRGNCSGWYHAFLIWKYQVQKMAELFAGSGTGYDVCKDMGIRYIGADLNPIPIREGILNIDAISDEVPMQFVDADMIFMHPPYSNVCQISWAGSAYPDPNGVLANRDLGKIPWERFMKTLNEIVMKYYAAMDTGARMGILMGDVRRNGKFYSMLAEIVKPGNLEQILIKTQHNTVSGRKNIAYANNSFTPLAHEYLMVLKKLSPYIIDFMHTKHYEMDIRDSKTTTWRDVVLATLRKLGGKATLYSIYEEIEGHNKCKNNVNWQAKVRQVLQEYKEFASDQRGCWSLRAA